MPQYKGAALDDWTLTRPHKSIRTRFAFRPPSTLVQVPATHASDVSTLEFGPCLPDPEPQPIWEEGHIPEVGAAWLTWSRRAAQWLAAQQGRPLNRGEYHKGKLAKTIKVPLSQHLASKHEAKTPVELRMWMRLLTALKERAWPARAVLCSMEKAIPSWWQWGQAWHASAFIQQSLDDEEFCSWSIWATENHIKHLRQKYGNVKAAAWREWCRKAFEPHQGGWSYLRDPQSKLQPAPM
eukprot:6492282-Amphidinium_carterae.1